MRKHASPVFTSIVIVCLSALFPLPSPLTVTAKEAIIAIGDSITQADTHWTVNGHKNAIQGGWVTRLGNLLENEFPDEYEVANKGINGDTTLRVLRRLDKDVILLKPDIVIIAIGTNDIFARLSATNPSSTPVAYQATMARIFNKLQLNLPGTPVFAIGMTIPLRKYVHIRFGDFLPQQEVVQAVFNDYNNILRELTKEYNFFYVDLPSQWPGDIEEGWKFYADGIHPNNAGYDFMTEILYDALTPTVLHTSQKNENKRTSHSVMMAGELDSQ